MYAIDMKCPKCEAKAGSPCVSIIEDGRVRGLPHRARILALASAQRAADIAAIRKALEEFSQWLHDPNCLCIGSRHYCGAPNDSEIPTRALAALERLEGSP